jgi:hypothetical protein
MLKKESRPLRKKEALLTTKLKPKLLKWAKRTLVAEVKQVERGKKFYYSSGSFEKQWRNLLSAKNNKTFYKHPDTGWGTPWDLTIYVKTPAYFIIFFDKTFYVIDIDKIVCDMDNGAKSLDEERAKVLCVYSDRV